MQNSSEMGQTGPKHAPKITPAPSQAKLEIADVGVEAQGIFVLAG